MAQVIGFILLNTTTLLSFYYAVVIKALNQKTLKSPRHTGRNYWSVIMNKEHILKNTESYHDDLIQSLKDPDEAFGYLQIAMEEYQEDNDAEALLLTLRGSSTGPLLSDVL